MKNTFVKFKNGFTLAEVLITLVIVGVIAALTIPTVVNNTKKQEYVTKLKKTYSSLAQATNLIISEYGNPRADIGGWAFSSDNVFDLYKNKLIKSKECNGASGCMQQIDATGGVMYLNGNSYEPANFNAGSNYKKLILSDGVQIAFLKVRDDCSRMDWGVSNWCIEITVDVNGEKQPNQWGRDWYRFMVTEEGLKPAGAEAANDCNKSGQGFTCAAKVLRENAMNY